MVGLLSHWKYITGVKSRGKIREGPSNHKVLGSRPTPQKISLVGLLSHWKYITGVKNRGKIREGPSNHKVLGSRTTPQKISPKSVQKFLSNLAQGRLSPNNQGAIPPTSPLSIPFHSPFPFSSSLLPPPVLSSPPLSLLPRSGPLETS